jgi:hypothetical protein
MENLIHDKENYILSDVEHLERSLLKLQHFHKLDSKTRICVSEMSNILFSLNKKLKREPRPSTQNLADQLNRALLENPDGDGVILKVFKSPDSKVERCSIMNFYLS